MTKVTVNEGVLVGGKCKTENNFEYYEFLQIPYAQPPTGSLRFKNPKPPLPWKGERDATKVNPQNIAAQIKFQNRQLIGSEDCLYLNVFTPTLPADNMKFLPVMVYIHGGGFMNGAGTMKQESGADYLVEHNVVVVSINYRLGVFGFLSLETPEASGNMGLKDQTQALKWVHENIAAFGGDKDNVTIFGISAGAASIEYLLLSKLTKGLISKAILQSGSTLNHWALNHNIKDLSIKLALELGYQGSEKDMTAIHKYLIKQPAEAIGEKAFIITIAAGGNTIKFGFVPSIEKDFGDDEAFITDHPYVLLKKGEFSKVPVIRGFCQYEGMMTLGLRPQIINKLKEEKKFTSVWDYPLESDDIEKFNNMFEERYLKDADIESSSIDFFSHYDFISGVLIASKIMVDHGVPLYMYMFAYNGRFSSVKSMAGLKRDGACHGDDTFYTMCRTATDTGEKITLSDSEISVIKKISTLWTNFAKTSNPTPTTENGIISKWPAFTREKETYLVIDESVHLQESYQPDRIAIFEKIYEKYQK